MASARRFITTKDAKDTKKFHKVTFVSLVSFVVTLRAFRNRSKPDRMSFPKKTLECRACRSFIGNSRVTFPWVERELQLLCLDVELMKKPKEVPDTALAAD